MDEDALDLVLKLRGPFVRVPNSEFVVHGVSYLRGC